MTKAQILDAIGKELIALRKAGAKYELVATTPKPILLIEWNGTWNERPFESAVMFLQYRINGLISGSEPSTVVRCVEIGRLPVILRQGCDVEPKDAVMWIDKSSSRALEYGGEQKVLMIFDIRRTEPSYQQVPADTDQATLDELQKTYPTVERSIDGSMLWLSRLPENDKRVASPYESEHGRWISSDPFAALSGLLVLGRDMKAMKSFVESSIAACDHPTWE